MEFTEYVTAIQRYRAYERGQRHLRQKRRHEYLASLQEELDFSNRAALHYDSLAPAIGTRSEVEQSFADFVRKTGGFWGEVCNQSVEQQFRYEQSLVDQATRRREYLDNVKNREDYEFQVVCQSDLRRWQMVRDEFLKYEEKIKNETVAECRDSVLHSAEKCIELMNDYCIDRAKDSLLAHFSLRRVTQGAMLSKSPDSHQEAFRYIFGRDAYGITGIPFKQLLQFAFEHSDLDKRATYNFDACSIPIIVVEGAKLSGKTLLANALAKKYRLYRFSDRSLIEAALLRASPHSKPALLSEEKIDTQEVSDAKEKTSSGTDRIANRKGNELNNDQGKGGEVGEAKDQPSAGGSGLPAFSSEANSRHLSHTNVHGGAPLAGKNSPTVAGDPSADFTAMQMESEITKDHHSSQTVPRSLPVEEAENRSHRPSQMSARKSLRRAGAASDALQDGNSGNLMSHGSSRSRSNSASAVGLKAGHNGADIVSQDEVPGNLEQHEEELTTAAPLHSSSCSTLLSLPQSRSPEWEVLGNSIRDALYRGEAIDQSVTAQLLRLQLKELKGGEDCRGVIFEGVLNRVAEIPQLLHSLVPQRTNEYTEMCRLWCNGLQEHLRKCERNEIEEAEGGAVMTPTQVPPFLEYEDLPQPRSQNTRQRRSKSRRASSAIQKIVEPPPPGIPYILAIPRVELEEPAKREARAKVGKRGVDLSQLPPPTLPVVEDITTNVENEEAFIKTSLEQLEQYTGLFSCMLHINCSPEEIFKRYAGLRLDRETSEQYHLVYHPPPNERMPYLVGCDRTLRFSSELYNVIFRQEEEWKKILEWVMRHPSLRHRVHDLIGVQSLENIETLACAAVEQSLDAFRVGKELYDLMIASQKRLDHLKRRKSEQVAAREAERQRLAGLYMEKGVSLPPELEPETKSGNWCTTPDGVLGMILEALKVFHGTYGQTYDCAWKEFSSLSCMILEYRRYARSQLTKLWRQPDDKQGLVDRFLKQFNTVPQHLRSKTPCKEELHLCADELKVHLFSSVEAKKKEGAVLIDHVVRHDAYLDGWEASVCNVGALLMQQEVERFTLVMNLVILYFSASQEEPVMFEEVDTDINLIRTFEAATGDLAANAGSAGRNKAEKKSAGGSGRKGHGRPSEESGGDSSILEAFFETSQRLCNGINTLYDKFKQKVLSDASGRGQKKVTLRSLKLSSIAACCVPFLESEQSAALERINCVKRFLADLSRQGDAYMQSIKAEMVSDAKFMLQRQASAVNSVIYHIRCAIESEDEAPSMHLGCGTFAVVPEKKPRETLLCYGQDNPQNFANPLVSQARSERPPSFLTDVPLYALPSAYANVPIHETLCAGRLLDILARFQCTAPQYQLCRDSFATIIESKDYEGYAKEGQRFLDVGDAFKLFDPFEIGIIDWREFIMHLLFWCSNPERRATLASIQHPVGTSTIPNSTLTSPTASSSLFIPEASVDELLAMKKYLFSCGKKGVTEDQFQECPFPFDAHLQADRRAVYVQALWLTFANLTTKLLDPFVLICFFCIDLQPIRGAQKAFLVLSDFSRGTKISRPALERILHIRSTNHRAVALIDPFSKINLSLLFGPKVTAISFKEMSSCAIGRYMLNQFEFMKRRLFVYSV